MARTTRPLTNTEVLRAKALEKDLTLHDGDGLFLIVKTSGKKLWRFRYQRPATKQRTMMGPVSYTHLYRKMMLVLLTASFWKRWRRSR